MHYKNGREAKDGDPVVTKTGNGAIQVGRLTDIYEGSDCCNAQLVRPLGAPFSVNIKDCFHASDALDAAMEKLPAEHID